MIDHQTLLSGHATHALRIFASGMNSGMTNKSSTWFRVTFDDINVLEEEGVKEWLEIVQNKNVWSNQQIKPPRCLLFCV